VLQILDVILGRPLKAKTVLRRVFRRGLQRQSCDPHVMLHSRIQPKCMIGHPRHDFTLKGSFWKYQRRHPEHPALARDYQHQQKDRHHHIAQPERPILLGNVPRALKSLLQMCTRLKALDEIFVSVRRIFVLLRALGISCLEVMQSLASEQGQDGRGKDKTIRHGAEHHKLKHPEERAEYLKTRIN
jgi:hypothetical protein